MNPASLIPNTTAPALIGVVGFAITNVTLVGTGGLGSPYTFNASALPSGINVTTAGVIYGTPKAVSSGTYAVTVKDKAGNQSPPVSASFIGK